MLFHDQREAPSANNNSSKIDHWRLKFDCTNFSRCEKHPTCTSCGDAGGYPLCYVNIYQFSSCLPCIEVALNPTCFHHHGSSQQQEQQQQKRLRIYVCSFQVKDFIKVFNSAGIERLSMGRIPDLIYPQL
jgi:hypothetical protein